ncbi:hypothetical protein EZV61_12480 [Corallincola luteus]|uniref:Polysaccharide biosynthesis protein C-terminal domain-containing protein n=1 Tax=Corallincola luteus TaxID=1775177 RepID=A0ABY2AJ97_9GAMM|nr:oligosaccharide flippase family protein [Corallincola luteus]TCI02613.1 hypothetical protein EZV61_12480 [Corallincola luteus]
MNGRVIKLLWIALEKFGITFISIATFFVYAKMLGPIEFGLAVLALSVGQGLSLIFGNLFEDAIVRHQEPLQKHFDSGWWGGIFISVVLCVLVVAISHALALQPLLHDLILLSIVQIPLVSISTVYVAGLRREGHFNVLAKRTIIARLLGAAVGLTMVFQGAGSWSVVTQAVLIELFSLLSLAVLSDKKIGMQFSWRAFCELVSVGWALSLRRLSWDASIRGIPIILGATAGAAAVGIYGLAWRMVEMPRSAIASGLLSYALPVFSRRQSDLPKLQGLFLDATKNTGLIVIPMFVGLSALAPVLLPWIFGSEWDDAIVPVQLLAIVAALSFTRIYIPVSLTALARPGVTLTTDIIGTVIALIVTYWYGTELGALAAAFAMLLRSVVVFPFSSMGLKKVLGIGFKSQLSTFVGAAFASLCMAIFVTFVSRQLEYSVLVSALSSVVGGGVCYLLVLTVIHPKWFSELKAFFGKS